ncbi:FAD-dependent oxidoreductase [Patescibacteria group bacterium]|nr:FAD-dependent oxidoreductase [Patescibacteria group bacterium]
MPKYTIHLKEKRDVADGTMAFYFDRPEGLLFKGGQNADYTLLNVPQEKLDAEGATRTFSFANAPSEEGIMIATRMRETAFKNILKELPEGSEMQIDGPYGNMVLHSKPERPAVMLAGGIGITPFRSMAVEAAAQKLPHKIFLFYSNRAPKDAAFLEELKELEGKNVNFKLIATMTDAPDWPGEKGYITKEMIERCVSPLFPILSSVFYLAGPPAMTAAMHKMLNDFGVSDDDIRMEEFAGY